MDLVFREIDPTKFKEVYSFNRLHEYSCRDSSDEYIPESEERREKKTRTLIERLLQGGQKYYCLAAFDGEEMIGAIFQDRYEIDGLLACHIHGLWVHADHRRKGVGKKLKELGENWAKRMACKLMDANVRVKNQKMISLNEKLGYEVARFNFRKKLD